jgi:small subunit ribosomal protein S14
MTKGDTKRTRSRARCSRCGATQGLIKKYGLGVCRRCFKEIAGELGFRKFD